MSAAQPPPERSPVDPSAAGQEQRTDELLIGRIQCRDEAALGALFDRWGDRVYSIAAHLLGGRDEADDVVERTFLQIWQKAGSYDPARGSVGAWITVMARSHALSQLRADTRRQRHDELRFGYVADEGLVTAASPLQSLEAGEDRKLVDAAVSRLPAEQQRVVRMTFFDGLSQSEIAASLGIPLGTVKTRVRLAFAKLRAALGPLRERDR